MSHTKFHDLFSSSDSDELVDESVICNTPNVPIHPVINPYGDFLTVTKRDILRKGLDELARGLCLIVAGNLALEEKMYFSCFDYDSGRMKYVCIANELPPSARSEIRRKNQLYDHVSTLAEFFGLAGAHDSRFLLDHIFKICKYPEPTTDDEKMALRLKRGRNMRFGNASWYASNDTVREWMENATNMLLSIRNNFYHRQLPLSEAGPSSSTTAGDDTDSGEMPDWWLDLFFEIAPDVIKKGAIALQKRCDQKGSRGYEVQRLCMDANIHAKQLISMMELTKARTHALEKHQHSSTQDVVDKLLQLVGAFKDAEREHSNPIFDVTRKAANVLPVLFGTRFAIPNFNTETGGTKNEGGSTNPSESASEDDADKVEVVDSGVVHIQDVQRFQYLPLDSMESTEGLLELFELGLARETIRYTAVGLNSVNNADYIWRVFDALSVTLRVLLGFVWEGVTKKKYSSSQDAAELRAVYFSRLPRKDIDVITAELEGFPSLPRSMILGKEATIGDDPRSCCFDSQSSAINHVWDIVPLLEATKAIVQDQNSSRGHFRSEVVFGIDDLEKVDADIDHLISVRNNLVHSYYSRHSEQLDHKLVEIVSKNAVNVTRTLASCIRSKSDDLYDALVEKSEGGMFAALNAMSQSSSLERFYHFQRRRRRVGLLLEKDKFSKYVTDSLAYMTRCADILRTYSTSPADGPGTTKTMSHVVRVLISYFEIHFESEPDETEVAAEPVVTVTNLFQLLDINVEC